MVLEPDMQFALAAALAASVLAVAAPALAPHHPAQAERSHAAAMWSRAAEEPDPLAEAAPAQEPGQ